MNLNRVTTLTVLTILNMFLFMHAVITKDVIAQQATLVLFFMLGVAWLIKKIIED